MTIYSEFQTPQSYILGALKRQQRDQRVMKDLRKTKKLKPDELKQFRQIYDCSRASIQVAALQLFCEEEGMPIIEGHPVQRELASRNDFNWYAELLLPDLSNLTNRSKLGALTAGIAGELVWHSFEPLTFLTDYMKLDSNHSPDFCDLLDRWHVSMNDESLEDRAEDFSYLFYQWADRNKSKIITVPLAELAEQIMASAWPGQPFLESPWLLSDVVKQIQSQATKPPTSPIRVVA